MDQHDSTQFTTSMLDVDIIDGRLIALEEITCNGCTSYAITMTALSVEDSNEYHEYYEYEVELFDAISHFKRVVSYVGSKMQELGR
jgi:hypothetical protein